MRKIVLLVSALLICLVLCSCGENESKQAPTIPNGELVPVTNDSGDILAYERRYLDDNGNVTRWDIYNADQEYQRYMLYEYNSNGKLTKESSYRADGIGEYYYTYEYDENGTLREKGYFTQSEGATRTLYDVNGFEVERYVYDKADNLTSHTVKENGKWINVTEPEATEAEAE